MNEEKKKVFPWKKVIIILAVLLLIAILIPIVSAVVNAIQIICILFPLRRVTNFKTLEELQTVMPDDFYYFEFEETNTPTRYQAIAPIKLNKKYISGEFEYECYRVTVREQMDDGSINATMIEAVKCGTKRRKKDFCPILDELGEITIDGIPCAEKGNQIYFFIDDVGYYIRGLYNTEEDKPKLEALISSRYLIDETNN